MAARDKKGRGWSVQTAHRRLANRLIDLPGVSGIAIGKSRGGPCLTVMVGGKNKGLLGRIPKRFGGYPVRVEKTGDFVAR